MNKSINLLAFSPWQGMCLASWGARITLLLSGTADISYRAVTWRWVGDCVRECSALHCTHSRVAARLKACNYFLFKKHSCSILN